MPRMNDESHRGRCPRCNKPAQRRSRVVANTKDPMDYQRDGFYYLHRSRPIKGLGATWDACFVPLSLDTDDARMDWYAAQ